MSEKIVQLNEEVIKGQIKELVRGSVEETLNELLEKEAESLTQAARYERSEARQGYRSGHYDRNLTTTSGDVTLHMPRLKGVSFETAIIERYRRRESSVEEALIEMYLAGVSVRRVEDITEALWGSKVSPATISELNKKAYVHIEDWRNRPLQGGRYPYVYVDGIYLRRNWGGEYENVAVLVAIAVNEDGFREVLGAAEGMKEDKASWVSFFQWLRGRGLDGVKLIVGDKCMGMLEAVGEVFPDAKYQRCTVHFYRNVFSVVPKSKVKIVAKMLKAIHAQESKKASREKAKAVVAELRAMKLKEAAKKVEDGIEETLTYCDFPCEHWTRIRTNNVIERLNREIRRRTRVVGTFPDGNSALMLVCARLRHDHPLKGLVRCGNCKRAMTRRKNKAGIRYFQCIHSVNNGNTDCPVGRSFPEMDIEKVVFHALTQFLALAQKEAIQNREVGDLRKSAIKECADKIRTLQKQNEQHKASKLRLYEKYAAGSITKEAYIQQKAAADVKIAENDGVIQRSHERMKELDSETACSDEKLDAVCEQYADCKALTYELTHAFISAVYIYDLDNIEIVWKFKDFLTTSEGEAK